MMTMAKVQLLGSIGKIESKYSPDGKFICEFSIAHNYGKGDNKKTNWFNGTFWEAKGELFASMAEAKTVVWIDGNLEVQEWTDKEGNNKHKLVVRCMDFRVLSKGKAKEDTPYDE